MTDTSVFVCLVGFIFVNYLTCLCQGKQGYLYSKSNSSFKCDEELKYL